ncbi:MAG TPA: AMP-binding protein, partial [Ramlibacter sp.]|nr:AMP-binding protein [Ramlibacter sp.]
FQVMFVAAEEEATGGWRLPGLELSAERVETGTAKFELTLFVTAAGEGLRVTAEYNTDLFAEQSMERLLGHYGRLLAAAVADASQPVAQLCWLSAAEREQLLVQWNETRRGYGGELLPEMFAAQVRRTPASVALVSQGRQLSYAELDGRANQLAQLLRERGVGPESRVGVLMERDVELVIALLAVLKAGGAYVPLDPEYPQERLTFMLADSSARLLLTQRRVRERLEWLAAQDLEVVVVDELESEGVAADLPRAISAANLAYVIYTSGSTGRPKGVAITHHSASVLLRWSHELFTPAELAGVLFSTSVCFDLSIFELFAPLTAGGAVILAHNALQLPELAAREQVTLINTVPSAMTELLRVGGVPQS